MAWFDDQLKDYFCNNIYNFFSVGKNDKFFLLQHKYFYQMLVKRFAKKYSTNDIKKKIDQIKSVKITFERFRMLATSLSLQDFEQLLGIEKTESV